MDAQDLLIPCCPELETDDVCDVLDFHYRHIYETSIIVNDQPVKVEVTMHTRLERCPGPLVLGDLVYSTTLLPGEKRRLFTQDRQSRFTFDSATGVSYRNRHTSQERYYMGMMSDFMSDVTVRDQSSLNSRSQSNWTTDVDADYWSGIVAGGGSVSVDGSYNASSSRDFLRELSQHAESSHRRSEMGTRATSSTSVGEVQTRAHSEGESEDHFESSSRVFSNQNRCQAVTYFFYQINKTQTVKFTLERIQRRVIDPVADTLVTNNPPKLTGQVSVIPNAVLATNTSRLEVEEIGRQSILAARVSDLVPPAPVSGVGTTPAGAVIAAQPQVALAAPLPVDVRAKALEEVDAQLVEANLLAPDGRLAPEAQTEFSFESKSSLPTPGILVKGCLDDCEVCDPLLLAEIEQEIRRKKLENDLLEKQIALLEHSQEYRCCPADEHEHPDPRPRP